MAQEKIRLSASKIKTHETCSWLYYLRYVDKQFPNPSNDGANRGSVVHYVLECLARPKRRKYVEQILAAKNPFIVASIERLVWTHARKLGVISDENIELIKSFLIVALENDFFCEGSLELLLEEQFFIEGKNYLLNGFIDQIAVYPDRVLIKDFKSSKAKFTADELEMNYQNLIYTLAVKKKYPALPVSLVFQFLKFKRAPNQPAPLVSDTEIAGFEKYLEYIADYLSDFTPAKATANYAKNNIKSRFLCGKCPGEKNAAGDKPAYICSAKFPSYYFVLTDADGKFVKSDFDKKTLDKLMQPGYNITPKSYGGCPAWKHLWA